MKINPAKYSHLCSSSMEVEPKIMLSPYSSAPSSSIDYITKLSKKSDVTLDIGSGKGETPIRFVEHGVRYAWGIECDRGLVDEAIFKIKERGLREEVGIIHNDVFRVNLLDIEPLPTLLTLNFTWGGLFSLVGKLERELEKGTRIFTTKELEGWRPPKKTHRVGCLDKAFEYVI